jgi:hypothetical protein
MSDGNYQQAQRQAAVQRLDPGTFTDQFGHLDIIPLKRGLYEAADAHDILGVVLLNSDLADYENVVEREAVLNKPQAMEADAAGDDIKRHQVLTAAWLKQSAAIREVKQQFINCLDTHAKTVIMEPQHGTIRRTIMTCLNLLQIHYGTMTIEQLNIFAEKARTTKWDASTDITQHTARFKADMSFLNTHAYAPAAGQQVVNLMASVEHVPAFTMIAHPAFYQTYVHAANQTVDNLIAVYERIYKTQYANTTAAQHHLAANQVVQQQPSITAESTLDTQQSAVIEGIMASARGSLVGARVSHTQLMELQAQVAKTIDRVLSPTDNNRPRGGPGGAARTATTTKPRGRLAKGVCPLHPDAIKPHTWAQCFQNPEKDTK